MISSGRHHLGLLGRILAILLLTVVIEFGASTFLYERANRLSLREDEARRLAEHLVIARKLIAERTRLERPAIAQELTTDRYEVRWSPANVPPPPLAAGLRTMRNQVLAWEPDLAQSDLRLSLASPGRKSTVVGGLRLPDGSWLHFSAFEMVHSWDLAFGRILLALIPAVGLLILGAFMIRRALSPLRRLANATEHIGLGEQAMIPEAGTDEVRNLIRAFNAMQLRIQGLIDDRTEALAAVGHDIRTPLARLQLRVDSVEDPDQRDAMGEDVAEMNEMIGSLLAFLGGEKDPERPVRTDIAVLAATIADDAADRGRDVSYEGSDHAELSVRPMGIRRAIGNLVENGLRYGTSVMIRVETSADWLCVIVEDDGPGIPEDRLQDVLRPFTRLDEARARNTQGLGLGLAIVVRFVDLEGGNLILENRPEGGLSARIALPAS